MELFHIELFKFNILETLHIKHSSVEDIQRRQNKKAVHKHLKKIGFSKTKFLTKSERQVAVNLILEVAPFAWYEIPGLCEKVKEQIEYIMDTLQPKKKLNQFYPSKVILVYGPSGCGKTLFVTSISEKSSINVLEINRSKIKQWRDKVEECFLAISSLAIKIEPCIVVIDDIARYLMPRTK